MERITAMGIDLKRSATSGHISGYIDIAIYNTIDAAEWDALKKAAEVLSKKQAFPGELKIEIEIE